MSKKMVMLCMMACLCILLSSDVLADTSQGTDIAIMASTDTTTVAVSTESELEIDGISVQVKETTYTEAAGEKELKLPGITSEIAMGTAGMIKEIQAMGYCEKIQTLDAGATSPPSQEVAVV